LTNSWHTLLKLVRAFYGDGEARLGPVLTDFFDTVPITGPRSELCELMTAHNSDKASSLHNYSLLYHFLFRHRRSEISDLFELGLGTCFVDMPSNMGRRGIPGASLRAWRDYFPRAKIVGADIDKRILFADDRISTYYVDQTDKQTIRALWEQMPQSFDVMIDDGLHEFEANAIFMQNSFWKLRPHGYYIIEDINGAEANLYKFHNLFSDFGLPGALLSLPGVPSGQNCLAIFRSTGQPDKTLPYDPGEYPRLAATERATYQHAHPHESKWRHNLQRWQRSIAKRTNKLRRLIGLRPSNPNRIVIEERHTPTETYRLELVRCGERACKHCAGGPAHGPYWFTYDLRHGKPKGADGIENQKPPRRLI